MKITKLFHRFQRHLTLNNGAAAVAVLIALSWLWGTVTTLQKNFLLQREVDVLDQEVQITELERDTLKFQQEYYRSSEYLELAARDKLNKALPGEKLIILPPAPQVKQESPAVVAPEVEASNFQQWMRFFFGSDGSYRG